MKNTNSQFTPSYEEKKEEKIIFIPNRKKTTSTIGSTGSPYWDYNREEIFRKI